MDFNTDKEYQTFTKLFQIIHNTDIQITNMQYKHSFPCTNV